MIQAIQEALRDARLDGWLFYDHHRRDPLAYRILHLPGNLQPTRRWYYFVPANGEPIALVHRIEAHNLDSLPGVKRFYSRWSEQSAELQSVLQGATKVAMQHSPNCAVPYVAMIDGGTIELIRSFGVDVVTSADLVQLFEARWSQAQLQQHLEAGRRVDRIRAGAFNRVSQALRSRTQISEFEVQQWILERFRSDDLITDHGPIVAVNSNASDPHYEPSAHRTSPIREGDLLLIDMWAKLTEPNAVYYDITWTGYCGSSIPERAQQVFAIVAGARDAAVRFLNASFAERRTVRGFEVDDASRSHIEQHGFGDYFFHRTGHSIGSDVHGSGANMDNYETHDERTVTPGCCFSIEPGIYLPEFGIRSEVNVFARETDVLVTGDKQDALLQLL